MVDFGYNSIMKLVVGLVVVSVILNASWRGGEDFKSPSVPLYERGKSSLLPPLVGDHPLTHLPPLVGDHPLTHLPPLVGDHPPTHLPPLVGGTKGGGKEVR